MSNRIFSRNGGWSHPTSNYRSGLEDKIVAQLNNSGVNYTYEKHKINYVIPASNHHYTPDFILQNGIIIEAKGLFETADRSKHLLIKQQYPNLEIRFIFSSPQNKLYKGSKTTYANWCDKHGFKYAAKTIPLDWLTDKTQYNTEGLITKNVKKT